MRFQEQHIGDLLLEAVCLLQHVFQTFQSAIGVGGFDVAHGRESDSLALVVDVGAGLGGFGVLFGG